MAVEVLFRGGESLPKRLFWHNRIIHITGINLTYDGREGTSLLTFFSLASDTAQYHLVWNRKTNVWRLLEVTTQ